MKDNKTQEKDSLISRIFSSMKAYLFTGILVTAPVTITFYMAYKLILFIDNSVGALIAPEIKLSQYFPFNIPGIGLVLLLVGLIVIGMFTTGYLGRFFVGLGEFIVSKMPFISSVYSLLKQVFETFFSDKKQSFNQVVLLEYPRKGVWVIGFVSAKTQGEAAQKLEDNMLNVFVPTTPNPTSGFLLFVPEKDVVKMDMTVEDGLKFVISCGIVTPEMAKNKNALKGVFEVKGK